MDRQVERVMDIIAKLKGEQEDFSEWEKEMED